jgi:3-methylfumaryl-CoA hydratase
MTTSLLTDEVLSIVGTFSEPRHGLVTAQDIRKYCVAVDDPDPLSLDRAAAQAAGYADVIAPPTFNAAALRPTPFRSGILRDGQYIGVAPPGLGHLQTMIAGQAWHPIRPAVAGEEIVEIIEIKSIVEKQGATGPVLFLEKEAVHTTIAGDPLGGYTTTLIVREPPPARAPFDPAAGGSAAAGDRPATERTSTGFVKNPDMISLFMFAATAWTIHRIHWDIPYAQSEGLPLPVIPGWMLAAYLSQLARERAPEGRQLERLAVRFRAPAHPGDRLDCRVEAQDGGDDLALAIVNGDGLRVTNADVRFAGPRSDPD